MIASLLPARPALRPPMALAVLAALALVLRLLVPMAPLPAASVGDPLAELLSGGGICHGDPDAQGKPPGIACVLCPLCAAPLPIALVAPPPLPPFPVMAGEVRHRRPPATAPPDAPFRIARPRGPPALPA